MKNYPMKGRMRERDGFFVADNAVLTGNLHIEKNANIWFGAVLRGDDAPISIGEGTNLQDATVIHAEPNDPVIVGKEVTVGHRAMIHCKKIGDRCLIGIGAILLGWAEIGEESLVAAGAVVLEKQIIPPRSLVVGIPGKVIRRLTEAEVSQFAKSAEGYIQKAKLYL